MTIIFLKSLLIRPNIVKSIWAFYIVLTTENSGTILE